MSNLDLKILNNALPMATHPKVLGLTLDPKTYIQHTHPQHLSTRTQIIKALQQATRGNNKILRTHPPHISSSKERLPSTLAQPRTNKSPFLKSYLHKVPTTPACTWWNRPKEDLSSGKSESTHPSSTVVKSIEVFKESSQLYAETLTRYSTELLTTGPDYDPLLLLLALSGDVHPNPGPSSYPCSVCFKNVTSQGTNYLCTRCSHWVHSRCSHWVHSRYSGLRNAADYRKANG